MKAYSFSLLFLMLSNVAISQNSTGPQLLDKAIAYHDPNGNWNTFNDTLLITMESLNSPDRESKIVIDLPGDYFYVKAVRAPITTEYILDKGKCSIKFRGNSDFDEATAKTHRLSCQRANMYKNYYRSGPGRPDPRRCQPADGSCFHPERHRNRAGNTGSLSRQYSH